MIKLPHLGNSLATRNSNLLLRNLTKILINGNVKSKPADDPEQREQTKELLLSLTDLDLTIEHIPHTFDLVFRGGSTTKYLKDSLRPKWMSPATFYQSRSLTAKRLDAVCPGCNQKFTAVKDGSGRLSFDYMVHLIEECKAYERLNLARECQVCHYKFINDRSLRLHVAKSHPVKKSN